MPSGGTLTHLKRSQGDGTMVPQDGTDGIEIFTRK